MICVQMLFRKALEGAHRLLCNKPVIAVFCKVMSRESLLRVPDHFLSERFLLFMKSKPLLTQEMPAEQMLLFP